MSENKVMALGCRLNIFEAELLKDQAKKAGLKNTIIVNTCTVTQEAHRQSMQTIRKLKKENPDSLIIVTGCAAEIDPENFANMAEVSKVIGNKDKFSIEALLSQEKIIKNNINEDFIENFVEETSENIVTNSIKNSTKNSKEKLTEELALNKGISNNANLVNGNGNNKNIQKTEYILPQISGFENKTRAFIQIQQGCDHRCTFCIIYQARGKSRSVERDKIISQIKQAVAFGHQDIVLTGVDISSWQRDALLKEPSQLGKLCMDILKEVPTLPRLRLSSLDPAVEDNDILTLLRNEPRFMPHLHLSLQAMNSRVLANMGRRHNKEDAYGWISKIREANPKTAIGADIICGFPRESDEQFIETFEAIKQLKIPFLHVFPYSERKGTVAVKMKAISVENRKLRANLLTKLGNDIKQDFFAEKLNTIEEVLVEANNNGYTKDYSLVKINHHDKLKKNTLVNVKIIGHNKKSLIAEVL